MKEIEPYWPKRIRVRLIIRARGLFITVSRQTINDKSTTNRISKKKIQNRIYFWFPGDILYLKNWEIGFTFCLVFVATLLNCVQVATNRSAPSYALFAFIWIQIFIWKLFSMFVFSSLKAFFALVFPNGYSVCRKWKFKQVLLNFLFLANFFILLLWMDFTL